jgi:hypothetical protein
LYTPNNCYGWGTLELVGAVSRAQDLSSTHLEGVSGIQTQTNETFTAFMEHTMTEYTNRGKDGGNIQNFFPGSQLPDEITIIAKYSSSWPKPTKFSIDAGEASGVEADSGIKLVTESGGRWIIESSFNYTAQLDSGVVVTNFPELKFDIEAPNFDDTISVNIEYFLNDMRGQTQNFTVSSFTDLPDLLIEELVVPSSISAGQEVIITARIVNDGLGPAKQFTIDFYSDDEIFQSVPSSNSLDPAEATNIQSTWIAVEGVHTLRAEIIEISPQDEDNSNHESQVIVQVNDFIDSQNPMVFITEPYQNEIVSGLVVVKGTASDNNNVERVEVRVAPNNWQIANGFQNWAWAWNTSQDLNGRYTLEARSFDGYNYSVIYSVEVEVTNDGANRRPTASLKSNLMEVYTFDKIIFSGNTSSDDSQVVKYQFNFGDSKETDWITDSWVEYYYEEAGEYKVALQVEDDEGVRSSSSVTVSIIVNDKPENSNPMAVIQSPQTGTIYFSDKPIQFSSQGSIDAEGDELLFTWSSSLDGELYTTPNFFSESFLSEGVHFITLTVVDSAGGSDSVSIQITIVLPNTTSDDPILPSIAMLSIITVIVFVSIFYRHKSNFR